MNRLKLKKRINIELLSKSLTKHIPVIQNDRGRIIECYITDCQIPTGTKVKFWAMKPSKKLVYNDCTLKDNVVSVELTNQTLAEKGSVACQLEFDGDVSSYEFFLDVERDISGNGVVSENESTVLDALLEEMRVAIANVKSETEKAKAATAEAKKATEEAIKATQESKNPIKEVTGSDITADQTHQGAAIIKELQGGMKQGKTNGYQLFDASKLPTKSAGGATVTNNGDGSFTVSGSGNLTETFRLSYTYTQEDAIGLLKVGKLHINKNIIQTYPYMTFGIYNKSGAGVILVGNTPNTAKTIEITEEFIDKILNGTFELLLWFYGEAGSVINAGTIKPMIYQDGDGTWEPFTGGAPSPNPDYPQEIEAIGGNGWFDGELTVGGYQINTGKYFSSYENYYTDYSQDYISCKPGDTIRILTTNNMNDITAWFYRADKSFIKSISAFDDITVPAESAYFRWNIQKLSTSWPDYSAVGRVAILINGKYVVKAETKGKNLISGVEPGCYVHNDGKKYPDSRYIRTVDLIEVETNKKYIVSYSGIKVEVSFLKYDENKKYLGNEMGSTLTIPSGCSYIALNFLVGSDVITNIQLEESVESTPYEPYKSSVSYIQLDSPLYEGDRIYLEDGELWEYRENGRVVFDGSEDEWIVYQYTNLCAYIYVPLIKPNAACLCDKFKYVPSITNNKDGTRGFSVINISSGKCGLFFGVKGIADNVSNWKSYLQSNPTEVVYKLATPTLKKLGSAEAFNLRTFDERTYIEVVGSKELGTENTFIVPRNQSGGLITDAFATSKRNEINAAGQANLASRISALEQLAVKESV